MPKSDFYVYVYFFWVEQLCVSGVWLSVDLRMDTNKEMCSKEFGVRVQILLKS